MSEVGIGEEPPGVGPDEQRPVRPFQPSLLWLMVGRRRRDQVERPLRGLAAPGVEVVEAGVTSVDPAARRIETAAGALAGDAMVVALGAEPDRDAVPGYREAALDFFSPDGAAACAGAASAPGARSTSTARSLRRGCATMDVPRHVDRAGRRRSR